MLVSDDSVKVEYMGIILGYFMAIAIDSQVEEMKERDRGERKMNDSEESEEIKIPSSTLTCTY